MDNLSYKLEAVLYTTGKFLSLEDMGQLLGIASLGIVRDALHQLQERYRTLDTALMLVQFHDTWKLTVKKDYMYFSETLLTDCELDMPTQETLAVIAYKSPVYQSEVIKIRGNSAYDHIHSLKELGFITGEKSGRTRLLKVTEKFYDYFDVVADSLKHVLTKKHEHDEH